MQKGYYELAFHAEDGIEKVEGNYAARIFTPESLAEYDRRRDAASRLAEATRSYGWASRLGTEQIEAILAVLEVTR